jgi:hypothetical protein
LTSRHAGWAAGPAFGARAGRLLVLLVAVLIAVWFWHRSASPPSSQPPSTPARYLGVYEPGTPASYQPVTQFTTATGVQPNLVLYYTRWFAAFPTQFAAEAWGHGAELIVQIDPTNINPYEIASGAYDGYLRWYAGQARAFGHPVVIGFAHEMNVNAYTWEGRDVPAATWVAAWRHVVSTIRAAGAANVTWMWTVSHGGPLQPYWPGASYVNWVGLDGYFVDPSDTYANVFGSAVDTVRSFTSEPILLSEVGVGPGTGKKPQDIAAVFQGVADQHLLGSVWFDVDQHGSATHQDWRLEGNQAAVAAFGRGARSMMNLAR